MAANCDLMVPNNNTKYPDIINIHFSFFPYFSQEHDMENSEYTIRQVEILIKILFSMKTDVKCITKSYA